MVGAPSLRAIAFATAVGSATTQSAPTAAQAPGFVERLRNVTFIGESVASARNLSGVVMKDNLLVLVDDELRGVVVGRRTAPDTYEFGGVVTLKASLPKGNPKEEFDLEALAVFGDDIVAVGSHSSVRTSAEGTNRSQSENRKRQLTVGPRPDRDGLFRFGISASGTVSSEISVSTLRGVIASDPLIAPFASAAGKENGVDIEGLAADATTLWVGFRGPVLRHGYAPVLRVTSVASPKAEALLLLPLGGRGIRDIVRTGDGFLLLAGPVGDSDQSEAIYWWNGLDCLAGNDSKGEVSLIGHVQRQSGGRAEGMAVVSAGGDAYELILVFDGVAGGSPGIYRAQKPRPASGAEVLCRR